MTQKIAIWAPSHNFVGLYLRNWGMYRQSEKKLVKQQYLLHMCAQYGELRPTSGWDHFGSLGHPSYFQRLPRLGSVSARQSSSECQPNFAALNKGRHLCSAGWPSRWALAHISSLCMKYLGGTAEQIYAKVTWKMCLIPCYYEFEGQRSGTKDKKLHFSTLSAACMWFVFSQISVASSYWLKSVYTCAAHTDE